MFLRFPAIACTSTTTAPELLTGVAAVFRTMVCDPIFYEVLAPVVWRYLGTQAAVTLTGQVTGSTLPLYNCTADRRDTPPTE